MTWIIRRARAGDAAFLRDMLYEAASWAPGGPKEDPSVVLARPRIAGYLSGWGRRGDTALVAADEEGHPVGAAWFRYFSSDEPGYGFIDGAIPELTVGVRPDLRGRGIGSDLLTALIRAARQQGIPSLSLSVEKDNPAARLYERVGFRPTGESDNALTMRLDLAGDAFDDLERRFLVE